MNIDETKCLMEALEEVKERDRIIECNTIDRVLEIIDEIDDDQVIKFGCIAYGDGKDELKRRILTLREGEQE